MNKVILILLDGMRSDSLQKCGNPYVEKFKKDSTYCVKGQTIFPPLTLPVHVSLFYDVEPNIHKTFTNVFFANDDVKTGLIEQLKKHGKKNAFFYDWEQLRNVYRAGNVDRALYVANDLQNSGEEVLTENAIEYINREKPDFTFFYCGSPDATGHRKNLMSKEYLLRVNELWNVVKKIRESISEDYTVIVTSDHGGHLDNHGEDVPEDMTIPVFFNGKDFEKNRELKEFSILDVAPTVAKLLSVPIDESWQGKPII